MQVRIHDLSLGGCLIEAPMPVQVGRRLILRLDLAGREWLSLECETVRVQERLKFAVKFADMDETKQRRLQQVIEHLASFPAEGSVFVPAGDT